MRFMMIRRSDAISESNQMPGGEIMAAMDKYTKEMEAAGILRGGEGLKPSSQGARVKFRSGKPTVTDGPFTETKELIAGYFIIDVPSKNEKVLLGVVLTIWTPGAAMQHKLIQRLQEHAGLTFGVES